MKHGTTEYQLAVARAGKHIVPTAYATLTGGHDVYALSVDGVAKLANQVAAQFGETITQLGSLGGCYNGTEQAAWNEEKVRELI